MSDVIRVWRVIVCVRCVYVNCYFTWYGEEASLMVTFNCRDSTQVME